MSALEAMGCGKPLVITDAGGLGHLVPSQGSLKVAPGDVGALAKALLRLLQDEALQAKMGLFNREYVNSTHSWDHAITELENIYIKIIERSMRNDYHLVREGREVAL